ncbi:MAG: 2-dehydropantoate 2-reductase [Verrucomicrobia bacterium]|nr:2-dehydropantoate 2-reductase [Verrucomicrobiota bacterium]
MRTLIVGIGALGGLIAARMQASGCSVWLATRNAESALALRRSGLRVTGVGGDVTVKVPDIAALDNYLAGSSFDLIVLATKAQDAIDTAPRLAGLLGAGGVLLPIQNGGVSQLLADRFGVERVLGGLSNLGATMPAPGVYEQRNAGHLLIGELGGRKSARAERVSRWLGRGVEVRVTPNLPGAIWSKLLLNCSVTTLGAIAGRTMRRYINLPEGRELFDRTYAETLLVARATGARPEPMIVDPVPPEWNGQITRGAEHDAWIGQILKAYGDLKPSMLQDFERGRRTEIDFINGYVVNLGRQLKIPTPLNEAIVETVQAITGRHLASGPVLLTRILAGAR